MKFRFERGPLSWTRVVWVAAALGSVVPASGWADPQGPMSFTFDQFDGRPIGMGLRRTVRAEGVITPGTTARLSAFLDAHGAIPGALLVLNSPGGSLSEGLALGRLIRARPLQTTVGGQAMGSNGVCLSACTLAFLGGSPRYVPEGSQFGVHRFFVPDNKLSGDEALDVSQVQGSEIVEYVNYMGIKPGFISEMNKASPQQINLLHQETMRALKVITPEYETNWEIKTTSAGDLYVLGATTDIRGTHKILIACPRSGQSGNPIIMVLYQTAESKETAAVLTSVALRIDDQDIALAPNEVVAMPHGHGAYIETTVRLNQRVLRLLQRARHLGVAMFPASHQTFVGFNGDFAEGREKVLGYLRSCPGVR